MRVKLHILIVFILSGFHLLVAQQTQQAHSGLESYHEKIDGLQDYSLITLDVEHYYNLLQSKDQFTLELPDRGHVTVDFYEMQIFSDDYVMQLASGREVDEDRHLPRAYRGSVADYPASTVTITSNREYLQMMFSFADEQYYLDQASRYELSDAQGKMVVYRASDIEEHEGSCGVTHAHDLRKYGSQIAPEKRSMMECKEVETALACDFLFFDEQGGETAAENEMTAILNNVQNNYDNEFNDELNYEIVTMFISDCSTCDPWTSSTSANALLDDFTNWADDDNGFGTVHDVGALWTDRDFNGGTIGLAWVGAVCTGARYHVVQHFTNNNGLLRVLQAHEFGHNWDALHDNAGDPFIMAPSVGATNDWSTASLDDINAFYPTRSCLADCSSGLPPIVDFSAEFTNVCEEGVVQFYDLSQNSPDSWTWTFPGGTPSSSTEQHPQVTYSSPGNYNVTLEVSNAVGTDETTRFSFITAGENGEDLVEYINFEDGLEDWTIENADGLTTWEISQADGAKYGDNALFLDNFNYNAPGERDVLLSPIMDLGDRASVFLSMEYAYARFNATFRDSLVISVSNDGGSTYERVFADTETGGGNFATSPDTQTDFQPSSGNDWCLAGFGPECFFLDISDYATSSQVQIKIENVNGHGNNMFLDNIAIRASCLPTEPPIAAFESSVQAGCAPLSVQFVDASIGQVTSRLWTFEGGSPSTSTEMNPTVFYGAQGLYDVTLEVTNAAGTTELHEVDYIRVDDVPIADFDYSLEGRTVTFINQSTGLGDVLWDFGDGNTSIEQDPVHTYDQDGLYTVTLTVLNVCGQNSATQQVLIVTPPEADFEADEPSGCRVHEVQFSNNSSSNSDSYEWIFEGGNPATSTLTSPTVVYDSPGAFTVTLIAFNAAGIDTFTRVEYIEVGDVPQADFDFTRDVRTVFFENLSSDGLSYSWDFGDGSFSDEENPIYVYSEDGEYVVELIVSNACGSDTVEQVVRISNEPTAGFSASPVEGCTPMTVEFTNESSSNAEGFLWTFEGGNPSMSTEENPSVDYSEAGTYTVRLEVTNAAGSDVMVMEDYITVGDIPEADFNYSQSDLTFNFINTSDFADSYLWDFGDGQTSTEQNPTHTYDSPGDYTVMLIASSICGSDTMRVFLSIPDIPEADFEMSSSETCVPFTVQFSDRSSSNTVSVLWIFEGGSPGSSMDFNPEVSYTEAGTYDVTLISFSVNASDTVIMEDVIVANGAPSADFEIVNNGLEVTFNDLSIAADSLFWDFGDGNTSTEPSPTHVFDENGEYEVCLAVMNECGQDTLCQMISTMIAPQAGISMDRNAGCAPLSIQFFDESQGAPETRLWTFEGGLPENSTEINPVVTYQNPGTFTVQLIVENSLGRDTLVLEEAVHIDIEPQADFRVEADDLDVRFVSTSDYADSLYWDFGDGSTARGISPEHSYSESGTYQVSLIAENHCGQDTFTIEVEVMTTSVLELPSDAFEIYPNPANNRLNVQGDGVESDATVLTLIDILGTQVRQLSLSPNAQGSWSVDLTDLSSGTYFVLVKSQKGTWMEKLIIVR